VTAIRKHIVDFIAIIALIAIALAVASVILANQRLTLPGWFPVLGQDFTEIDAELSTAQAVTPGQGQTVNVAGVEVGEISGVRLEDGKAIVTLKLEEGSVPVYKNASVLLRPKTGLKDMVAELTPGTKDAGELDEGQRIPIGQTAPDVNLDEILAVLDGDTRNYLQLLLADAGQGLDGTSDDLANTIRRFEPTARYTLAVAEGLAERRRNIKRAIHNFSLVVDQLGGADDELAEFVENSNAVFAALASQDANLRATLEELPSTLTETQTALGKAELLADELGPTLQALRPGARALGPSLRQTRPFLRETTPILRDEIRPFVRASRPLVKELRPAARDLSALTPNLVRTFKVVNALLNTLAYNPPGPTEEGFLFWQSWVNHLGPAVFSNQDGHGPIRRGLVVFGCQTANLLDNIARANPQLGTLSQLLETPHRTGACPAPPARPTAARSSRSGGDG
jgi:phospholipid/cholesterol/gamma-HCH transport system substrate-binding protein